MEALPGRGFVFYEGSLRKNMIAQLFFTIHIRITRSQLSNGHNLVNRPGGIRSEAL
jgi:hypothetical protein